MHVIGISSLAAGHKTLMPELVGELGKMEAKGVMVVAGGVIPKRDYEYLENAGVSLIFGPGTVLSEAARDILLALMENLG